MLTWMIFFSSSPDHNNNHAQHWNNIETTTRDHSITITSGLVCKWHTRCRKARNQLKTLMITMNRFLFLVTLLLGSSCCCWSFAVPSVIIRGGSAPRISSLNSATTSTSTTDSSSSTTTIVSHNPPPSWDELESMLPETTQETPVLTLYR